MSKAAANPVPTQLFPHLAPLARKAKLHRLPDAPNILRRRRFAPVRARFYAGLWDEAARAVGARNTKVAGAYQKVTRGSLATFTAREAALIDTEQVHMIVGERLLSFDLMARHNIPAPRHVVFDAATKATATQFLRSVDHGIVVKPLRGTGGGRGVTTRVETAQQLAKATKRAARFSPDWIAEEQLDGSFFRLLYIDGTLIDIVRRDPPVVTGDGRRTIRQLVAAENARRLTAATPVALSPLLIDNDMRNLLARGGRRLSDRPATGEQVVVKGAVNENAAEQNTSLGPHLPQDTDRHLSEFVRALGIRVAGIDVIGATIDAPLEPGGLSVIEINANPGLHHHVLISNPEAGVPVAEHLLDYIFSTRAGVVEL